MNSRRDGVSLTRNGSLPKRDPQTQNKRYTPQQYARLKAQRLDRERVTGNSEKGKWL